MKRVVCLPPRIPPDPAAQTKLCQHTAEQGTNHQPHLAYINNCSEDHIEEILLAWTWTKVVIIFSHILQEKDKEKSS